MPSKSNIQSQTLYPVDVSVIIPMYNAAKYIKNTLASLRQQQKHGLKLEIIVIDDVSTDNSREIVSQLSYPEVRLICLSQNGGSAQARNAGLAQASGKWIQFVDSDDSVCNDLYTRFENCLEPQYNVYVFSLQIQYPDHTLFRTIREVKDKRAFGYFYAVWNLFIQRELCLPFNAISRQNEDVCFVFDMLIEKTLHIGLIPDAYYFLNRTNEDSKMAHFKTEQYLQMYRYVASRIKQSDTLTRLFFVESFVGILFARELPLVMRIQVASKTLLRYWTYIPAIWRNGIRHCIENKKIIPYPSPSTKTIP